MPTALPITSRLNVTPLFDIHHPQFEKLYRDGVRWSLFKERTDNPVTDRFVLENLRSSLAWADADGQHAHWLPLIGLYFGRLHCAILSPQTGKLRPGVTSLVSFQNQNAAWGHHVSPMNEPLLMLVCSNGCKCKSFNAIRLPFTMRKAPGITPLGAFLVS